MKLFGEVLQCIDGYRAGKFDPLIQEVNASFADGRQRIPTGPIFENFNGDPSAPHEQQRCWSTGDDGFHTDLRPLLWKVCSNGFAASYCNNLCDEGALTDRDDGIVGNWSENLDHWSSLHTRTNSGDSLFEPCDQGSGLRLAVDSLPETGDGLENTGDSMGVNDVDRNAKTLNLVENRLLIRLWH